MTDEIETEIKELEQKNQELQEKFETDEYEITIQEVDKQYMEDNNHA